MSLDRPTHRHDAEACGEADTLSLSPSQKKTSETITSPTPLGYTTKEAALDAEERLTIPDAVKVSADYDISSNDAASHEEPSGFQRLYARHRRWFHFAMWILFTGFVCAALALQVPKGYSQENLILGLIYAWFSLYILFCYVPATAITKPCRYCIRTVTRPIMRMSLRLRSIIYALLVATVIIAIVFAFPEKEESKRVQRLNSLVGVAVFLGGTFAFSKKRSAVDVNTISTALLLQFLLALFVFRSQVGHDIFQWLADFCEGYLQKSYYGTQFLFGDAVANSGMFVILVLPAVIFFGATVQILYYLGALQWLVQKVGFVFMGLLNVSGAEAMVACASPFLGMCENTMMIKPLLPYLTDAEMHQLLTSGFATISGSVLYAYIAMGVSGQALLTSCIMSIPCSIAISKLRYPETEEPITKGSCSIPPSEEKMVNLLHAAGIGAAVGLNIALMIAANLICLLALLYAINAGLTWLGNFLTIQDLTLQLISGYIFVPVAWMIGADTKDLVVVGRLMAIKIWANEFVAYNEMTTQYSQVLSPRSKLAATYALCGFANLGSVGMQIGVITSMAPTKAADASRLAVSALLCGVISTWLSASIASMLI